MDDFDDVVPDAMSQTSKNKAKRMNSDKAAQQQRARAIGAHKKQESVSFITFIILILLLRPTLNHQRYWRTVGSVWNPLKYQNI